MIETSIQSKWAFEIKLTSAPGRGELDCLKKASSIFYDHPEISHRMVRRKIENAKATGAGLWATGCPGCRVNLMENMSGDDKPAVVHPVEIVSSFVIESGFPGNL